MKIDIPRERIEAFCLRWKIAELALFGSVLRDDFRPDSDVDVMVTFADGYSPSITDLLDMEDELKEMFGRDVDLVERRLVEGSRNYIRRKHILSTAETVYAA